MSRYVIVERAVLLRALSRLETSSLLSLEGNRREAAEQLRMAAAALAVKGDEVEQLRRLSALVSEHGRKLDNREEEPGATALGLALRVECRFEERANDLEHERKAARAAATFGGHVVGGAS